MSFEAHVTGGSDLLPPKFGMIIELPEPINVPAGSDYFTWIGEAVPELQGVTVFRSKRAEPDPPDPDSRSFVCLRFQQVQHPMPSPVSVAETLVRSSVLPGAGEATDEEDHGYSSGQLTFRTVVEAVTPVFDVDDEHSDSDAFDACLLALNRYLKAYSIVFGEPLRPVTRERLPMGIIFHRGELRQADNWDFSGLLMLHARPPSPWVSAPDDTAFPRLLVTLSRLHQGDPISRFLDHWLRADHAFENDGDYSTAVIRSYMACEALLDAILTLMMWEEGITPEDAATTAFNERTVRRVKTQFSGRLGGNWETDGKGAIAGWARVLGGLRHRIIHLGHEPTRHETLLGMAAMRDLDVFVRERVVAKSRQYPRTALLFLGEPGLQKRGGWTKRMQAFVAGSDDEPEWVPSYVAWRDRFDPIRPIYPTR